MRAIAGLLTLFLVCVAGGASRAKAVRRGDIEGAEEAWIAFLVALTDPDRRKR
jgi:hypothetical protein